MTGPATETYYDTMQFAFDLWAGSVDEDHQGDLAEGQYRISGETDEHVIYDTIHPEGLKAAEWIGGFAMRALPGISATEIDEMVTEVDTVSWQAGWAGRTPKEFARLGERFEGCVIEEGCPIGPGSALNEVSDPEHAGWIWVANPDKKVGVQAAGLCLDRCGMALAFPAAKPQSVPLADALAAGLRTGGQNG